MKKSSKVKVNTIIISSLLFFLIPYANAEESSFVKDEKSLNLALHSLYKNNNKTFFNGCEFSEGGKLDSETCSYKPVRTDGNEASEIKWKRVFSALRFGENMPCWKEDDSFGFFKSKSHISGCLNNSGLFKDMYYDMHNIVPVVGSFYNLFKDYDFNKVLNAPILNGVKENKTMKVIEPDYELRGTIARIYFYMSKKYSLRLSRNEFSTFLLWNNLYPPHEFERWSNSAIKKIQGNDNEYISHYRKIKTRTNR